MNFICGVNELLLLSCISIIKENALTVTLISVIYLIKTVAYTKPDVLGFMCVSPDAVTRLVCVISHFFKVV